MTPATTMNFEDALMAARLHIRTRTLLSDGAVDDVCEALLYYKAMHDIWREMALQRKEKANEPDEP